MKWLALTTLTLGLAASGATAAEQIPAELVYVSGSEKGARIFVIREDGTGKHRLTKSKHSESQVAYSRNGKRIAFSSIRGTNQDLYVMNADGSCQMPIFASEFLGVPRWRPRSESGPPLRCTTPG